MKSVKVALVVASPTLVCSKCGKINKFPEGGVLLEEYVYSSALDNRYIQRKVKESKKGRRGRYKILIFEREVEEY